MSKKYFTHRNLILLLVIVAFGVFFRAYKIDTNYYFSGELGKELLFIRQAVLSKTLPLVGMATSHAWLYYGPLYYWVMIPIFIVFSGNPYILFWVALSVATLGLVLNYLVVKRIVDEKVALFSTLVQAFSPLLIWQTRLSKLHVFFWVLMPILMYLLYLLWNGKRKVVFLAGLVFGLLFSFHFSQIPLLGVVVLLFWIKKDVYKFVDWVKFGAGMLLPNIMLIWQDKSLALWLPYRIVNTLDANPSETFGAVVDYFGKTIFWDSRFIFVGFILTVILFGHYIYTNRKNLTHDFLSFYLIASVSLMVIANCAHGVPPIHYFLPLFTTVPILLGLYMSRFKYWPFVFAPIVFVNLIAFTNDPLFYKSFQGNVKGSDIVSYEAQNNVVSFILDNAKGNEFSIERIGPFDYFPGAYSQNYKYLLLWRGGKLVEGSTNVYRVTENESGVNVQK